MADGETVDVEMWSYLFVWSFPFWWPNNISSTNIMEKHSFFNYILHGISHPYNIMNILQIT